jgi:hypothetical protein
LSEGTEIPLLLLWLDLEYLHNEHFILCHVQESHFFSLLFLPFELYLPSVHGILQFRKSKSCLIFTNSALKKGWTFTHEKCYFLLVIHYPVNEIKNLISNFT